MYTICKNDEDNFPDKSARAKKALSIFTEKEITEFKHQLSIRAKAIKLMRRKNR